MCLSNLRMTANIIVMMESVLIAIPALSEVVNFTLMMAVLFGLIGIQVFAGSLRRSCVLITGGWLLGLAADGGVAVSCN